MQAALALADRATPVEQALIRALPARYPQRNSIEDQSGWDKDYSKAMRKVFAISAAISMSHASSPKRS